MPADDGLRAATGMGKPKRFEPNSGARADSLAQALQHHRAGRIREAEAGYRAILKTEPRNTEALYLLGLAAYRKGQTEAAIEYVSKALSFRPEWAEAHYNLGNLLRERGKLDTAIERYRKAIALQPDFVEAHYNLGGALRERGRFEEARRCYERVLTLRPDYAGAHRNLAELKTYSAEDNQLRCVRRLLTSGSTSAQVRIDLEFALAKALGDMGAFDEAFSHFLKGNRLKRSELRYDVSEDEACVQEIISVFDESLMARHAHCGCPSDLPILIVGMPRSGTTLVEQILASHPNVHGAGELEDLGKLVLGLRSGSERARRFPQALRDLKREDIMRLGRAYADGLRQRQPRARHVTDKMPSNFFHLGLVRLILPNAKIVHCIRDPADTCLSCFERLFAGGNEFSYDLTDLGRYYRLYWCLMQHWHGLFSENIFTLRYEDLVASPESEIRRLLSSCALPQHDACLRFHETDRPVQTASALRVHQPIDSASVGRWKCFRSYLQPLLDALGPLATAIPAERGPRLPKAPSAGKPAS